MQIARSGFMMIAFIGLASVSAYGQQDYPNKPIRILTSEAGGAGDVAARMIAQGISGPLGQQVIVDNRGIIAGEMTAKAPPDGYTLLYYGSTVWLVPFLRDTVPYDPVKDFAPITLANKQAAVLVVHPAVPVSSVKELIELAKAKPGALNYGSGPAGSPNHLQAELFKSMAGVNIVRIPYKGIAPALNDLIAGQLQLMFPSASSVTPHIKSGRMRALAVTSAQPSPMLPGLPSIAGSGLPGYESVFMLGMFAPARTPAAIITRVNQEVVKVLNRTDVKEKFFGMGTESVGSTPEAFAAAIREDMTSMGKVIKDAGIRED